MGNTQRSPEDYRLVANYQPQHWKRESTTFGCQVWRHKYLNQAVEVHRLYETPTLEDMNCYELRSFDNDLVRVYHLVVEFNQTLCTKNEYVQILVEYLPLKFFNLHNIDRQEALTILVAALRGFRVIEGICKPVVPTQELIGFNENGRPKIWINKHPQYNFSQINHNQNETSSTEADRVRVLFELVEQKVRYTFLPPIIKMELCKPDMTFSGALFILQNFAYHQRLNLKKYLKINLLNPVVEINSQSSRYNYPTMPNVIQGPYHEKIDACPKLRRVYSLNSINSNNFCHIPVLKPQFQVETKQSFTIYADESREHHFMKPVLKFSFISNQANGNTIPLISNKDTIVSNKAQQEVHNDEIITNLQVQISEQQININTPSEIQQFVKQNTQDPQVQTVENRVNQLELLQENKQYNQEEANKDIQSKQQCKTVVLEQQTQSLTKQGCLPTLESNTNKTLIKQEVQRLQKINSPVQTSLGINPFLKHKQSNEHIDSKKEINQKLKLRNKSNLNLIAQLKDDQIELYIRQKYNIKQQKYTIQSPSTAKKERNSRKLKVDRVQSKVATIKHIDVPAKNIAKNQPAYQTNEFESSTNDFLDVNFLQKSLDMRYNTLSFKCKQNEKREEDDNLNIAKLEEGLMKFSKSQLSQKNTQKDVSRKSISIKQIQEKLEKYGSSSIIVQERSHLQGYNHPNNHPLQNVRQVYEQPIYYISDNFKEVRPQTNYQEKLSRTNSKESESFKNSSNLLAQAQKMKQPRRKISYDQLRYLLWN